MTKILDFLYDNYIYVIIISSFLIITLIGFISKESKKENKVVKNNEENSKINEINNIETNTVVEQEEVIPNNFQSVVQEETKPNILQPVVEIGTQRLQVKLEDDNNSNVEHKNPEIFKLDDTIILNREELDKEVDIIEFEQTKDFISNNDISKPID
ncbi:MAG: hypothetical protein PHR09_00655 [Bacilli bacterium]|jgi:hypothetical protein|nr:hypothetical protein [Bacilli bacterium]